MSFRGTIDDGQTNSVLFDLSVWPSMSFRGTVGDGQTNSVLFDLSVWPSSVVLSQRPADVLTVRQTHPKDRPRNGRRSKMSLERVDFLTRKGYCGFGHHGHCHFLPILSTIEDDNIV
jgi:hypothetical protein